MRYSLTLLAISAICISNSYAEKTTHLDYATKLLQTIAYVDKNQTAVWPGFRLDANPIVAHFNPLFAIDVYAFHFQPKNRSWKRIMVDNEPVYYLNKDLYDLRDIVWGFQNIDGQDSYIFEPQENSLEQNIVDTVWTRFYNYQHYTGESHFRPVDPASYPEYKGAAEVQQVKLDFLEIAALKNYLQENDSAKKENSLKDAIAINQYRISLLDKESSSYEAFASLNWGVSNFVAWKSLQLKQDNQYISSLDKQCAILSATPLISIQDIQSCLEYNRYKFSTLTYGLALDKKLSSDWKSAVEKTGATVEQLMQHYYNFSNEEAEARVSSIIKHKQYSIDEINQALSRKYIPYLDAMTQQENNYQQYPGTEVQVMTSASLANKNLAKNSLAKPMSFSISSDTDGYNVSNKVKLFSDYTGRMGEESSIDNKHKFVVNFRQIPFVFSRYYAAPGTEETHSVKFKVSPDTQLIIDGQSDTVGNYMQSKKNLHFNNLTIKNDQVTVNFTRIPGDLNGTGTTLILNWDNWGLKAKS